MDHVTDAPTPDTVAQLRILADALALLRDAEKVRR
jgi:hypothetical protein